LRSFVLIFLMINYLLEKSKHRSHIFKLVPVEYKKPNTGTWAEYQIDGVIKFLVNSSHPEAIDFFQNQIQINKEREIMQKDLQTTNSNALVTAGASIEQSRAVAETQASMLVAKKFPRDENLACQKIVNACQRPGLAESGMYAYKRGTALVTGASIRLAEVMAKYWGNINYGFREIGRTEMTSEVEVFCWDMENNVRVTRAFTVKHWRDTSGGGYPLKTERDIYELIANNAQRRVRACILEMIPGDIVESAENECKKTLSAGDGRPVEERIESMLKAFQEFKVSQNDIETFLGHKTKGIVPAELVKLQNIYKSIKDGIATREEFFAGEPDQKSEKQPLKNVEEYLKNQETGPNKQPEATNQNATQEKPQKQAEKQEKQPKTTKTEELIEKSEKVVEAERLQATTMKEMLPDQWQEACDACQVENDIDTMTGQERISVGAAMKAIVDLGNNG